MKKDTHNFIQQYKGLGAFGMDRKTDEETIMFYLQKFSEDKFMETFLPRLSNKELEEIYLFINNRLKKHISEDEYHKLFLKDK
ncbi:MAG: cytoplasmic protein [Desulfobacteraceae bacterium]|nr:cytoplasmic protein [Desulfobacteraceae bacterium]